MRLNFVDLAKFHARVYQDPRKVPFKERHPLELQPRNGNVRKQASKESHCLYEMSLLFTCLKDNNFENNLCNHQIERFQNCMKTDHKIRMQLKLERRGDITPGAQNLTDLQVNKLLRQYPTI
ncbi:small ribosomal subunit protein mS37 [Colletes latitarsis]|uniref:small ribosomal subunit protein mS37 n=1 Tax=Colletes latitarsis TaxID=2605962 RepID=UPI004035E55A